MDAFSKLMQNVLVAPASNVPAAIEIFPLMRLRIRNVAVLNFMLEVIFILFVEIGASSKLSESYLSPPQ